MSGVNWIRAKSSPKHLGERPGDERLAQSREVLEQDVAAGQDADEDQFEAAPSPHHGPFDLVQHLVQSCAVSFGVRVQS